MSSPFRRRIRQALADANLQRALDNNAARRNAAREQVFNSLPEEFARMRQRAHQVRAEVIANLEGYLEQFEAQARRNGIQVHYAAGAEQAVEVFLRIAQAHHARLIAKSKTMVSEEIGLNAALERHGLRVVETDLGEFIVQLRGEHPAHLVTPAVHLRREQVGETFREKLGVPYTDNVAEMTAVARDTLRQVFLQADIGVSGVNFGVAENGWLCLLTNEGNGRMVTTLPRVHVALMGIERLVPTMADLALMLYLLPRSATGQKITVYLSLIRAPSKDDEGPQERHLILVDNGRLAIQRSALYEALFCIRCAACLNACPVFRELGGHAYVGKGDEFTPYVGPIGALLSPGLFGHASFAHLARASSLCGACEEVCPVGIEIPKLLLRVRAGLGSDSPAARKPLPNPPFSIALALKVFSWLASSARRFQLAGLTAGLLGRLLSRGSTWMHLPAWTGWGLTRDVPRPAPRAFRRMWNSLAREQEIAAREGDVAPPSLAMPHESSTHLPSPEKAASLIERFADEWRALDGVFVLCRRESLAGRILEVLHDEHETTLLAWQESYLPHGLLQELTAHGIRVIHRTEAKARLGLTGVAWGIAESGTLVLPGDAQRRLSVSLLPEIHLAVLEAKDILPDLPAAFERMRALTVPSIVLVSGPSRTADIEMTLTVGVHGPRKVIVFCIETPKPGDE